MTTKNIDYIEIVKKAYHYILKYKYLWILGVLAGGGASFGNGSYSASGSDFNNLKNFEPFKDSGSVSLHNIQSVGGKVLGAESGVSVTLWIIIAIIVLALIILCIILSTTARGAIISTVDKIDSGQSLTFGQSWREGYRYFWRVFLLTIIVGLIVFIPLSVFGGVIVGLVLLKLNVTAIILGLLFLLVFITFVLYLALVVPYSERILVIENLSALKSISAGFKFFNKNWKNALLMYLILIALNLGAGMALVIGIGVVVVILGLIGFLFYLINHILFWIYVSIAGFCVLILMLIASGIIQSYTSTVYTLTYREIKKLEL